MNKKKFLSLFVTSAMSITMAVSPAFGLPPRFHRDNHGEFYGPDRGAPTRWELDQEKKAAAAAAAAAAVAAEVVRIYNETLSGYNRDFKYAFDAYKTAFRAVKKDTSHFDQQRKKYIEQRAVVTALESAETKGSYMLTEALLKGLNKQTIELVEAQKKDYGLTKFRFEANVKKQDNPLWMPGYFIMMLIREGSNKKTGAKFHERIDAEAKKVFIDSVIKSLDILTEKIGPQATDYMRSSEKLRKELDVYRKVSFKKFDAEEETIQSVSSMMDYLKKNGCVFRKRSEKKKVAALFGGYLCKWEEHEKATSEGRLDDAETLLEERDVIARQIVDFYRAPDTAYTHRTVWSVSDGIYRKEKGFVKGVVYQTAEPAPARLLTSSDQSIVALRLNYLSAAHRYGLAREFEAVVNLASNALVPSVVSEHDKWLKTLKVENDKLIALGEAVVLLRKKAEKAQLSFKAKKKTMNDILKTLNKHEKKGKRPLTKLVFNVVPKANMNMLALNAVDKNDKIQYAPYHMPIVPKGSPLSGKVLVLTA